MIYLKQNGSVAYAEDFNNVVIELTPLEWQELVCFFEYRKHNSEDIIRPSKKYPSPFSKANQSIYKKLIENKPKLKGAE